MANFLLICDPDAARRQRVALSAKQRIAFLPHLRAEISLSPNYAVVWAATTHAPLSLHRAAEPGDPDCILFGEPHGHDGAAVGAAELARRYENSFAAPPELNELNGYYAALVIHPRLGIRVEGDPLGVFPIYYWQQGDVLLVASSPALFRWHPWFSAAPDLHGIAALLLTSGIVAGRTLWRGVRRLAADHVLTCEPGSAPREVPPAVTAGGLPAPGFEEAVDEATSLHTSFLRAALRSSRQPGLLLSGGLDSRILAGLTTDLGLRPQCLTFGRREDLEARCAAQVARELELTQTMFDVSPEEYVGYASSSVSWEQLSGGLYIIPMGWNVAMRPPPVAMDRMVSGLTLDAVIGGPKFVATADRELSFERLRIGMLGHERTRLARLIADPDLLRACEDVRGELVQRYRNAGEADHLREWRTNLAHRHRFAVGACAWRFSFYAWPVMPSLDRRLLRLVARLPYATVENRRIQRQMLVTRFPRLARLDLDRNSLDTIPLVGAPRSLAFDVRRRVVKYARRAQAWIGREPRYYVRTMAFNGPGWRAVRESADRARAAVGGLFHRGALAETVPAPNVNVRRLADPIVGSTPLKNTVGLMLWMRQHG